MHLPEISWPPERFKSAFRLCMECGLVEKMRDPSLLRELDKKARRIASGNAETLITIRFYLVGLSVVLEDLLENEEKFNDLQQKRGDDAIWDATFAAYLLMLYMDILPDPLT